MKLKDAPICIFDPSLGANKKEVSTTTQPFEMFAPCVISSSAAGCITLGQTVLKNVIFETAVMHSPKRIYFLSTVAVFSEMLFFHLLIHLTLTD